MIGATEEAAPVVLLFLIGELLEGVAASRARASIHEACTKDRAARERRRSGTGGRGRRARGRHLIQVRPGDRVPADGVVVAGDSSVDEAHVVKLVEEATVVMIGATSIRPHEAKP